MGFLGDEKKSFFGKLQQKIQDVILMRPEIDEETFDELEEALITSDIGMETTMRITDRLRQDIKKMKLHEPKEVQERLKEIIKELKEEGITILWIHHNLAQVKELADTVTCIKKRMIFCGDPKEELKEDKIMRIFE